MNLDLEDLVDIQVQPLFPCMALAKAAFLSGQGCFQFPVYKISDVMLSF